MKRLAVLEAVLRLFLSIAISLFVHSHLFDRFAAPRSAGERTVGRPKGTARRLDLTWYSTRRYVLFAGMGAGAVEDRPEKIDTRTRCSLTAMPSILRAGRYGGHDFQVGLWAGANHSVLEAALTLATTTLHVSTGPSTGRREVSIRHARAMITLLRCLPAPTPTLVNSGVTHMSRTRFPRRTAVGALACSIARHHQRPHRSPSSR